MFWGRYCSHLTGEETKVRESSMWLINNRLCFGRELVSLYHVRISQENLCKAWPSTWCEEVLSATAQDVWSLNLLSTLTVPCWRRRDIIFLWADDHILWPLGPVFSVSFQKTHAWKKQCVVCPHWGLVLSWDEAGTPAAFGKEMWFGQREKWETEENLRSFRFSKGPPSVRES